MTADVLWSLDRIEGSYAVLISDHQEKRIVLLDVLSDDACEGNLYRQVGDTYVVDVNATKERRERVRRLQGRLRRR